MSQCSMLRPRARYFASLGAAVVGSCLAWLLLTTANVAAEAKASSFRLANGMQVVVIPDNRAPVVTHMVWYRVGAADDPQGKSGLAHFLEHLMFKATARLKTGDFTRTVNRLGGRHNALTAHDTTAYFQRAAKEHLGALMELEADRMASLRFDAAEVATERDVIMEERRASVEASPVAMLNEQMLAALYQNHPYRRPVLGWAHEIAGLDRTDAAAFYERNYAPDNSILVVAGDVTEAEVRALAERSCGRISASLALTPRQHPQEPPHISPRRVRLEDARVGEPLLLRYYHVPSLRSGTAVEAAALTVLARILGGDDTSRLYRTLVIEKKLAVQAGADYQSGNRDSGRLAVLALAAKDRSIAEVEAAIDEVIETVASRGLAEDEVLRAKRGLEADQVFELDNQEKRARRYGEGLTVGRTLGDIEGLAAQIQAVTAADVRKVAVDQLQLRRSVTGLLTKPVASPR